MSGPVDASVSSAALYASPRAATAWLRQWRRAVLPAIVAVLVLGSWEALIVLSGFPRVILPAPSDIAAAIIKNYDSLLVNSWPTLMTTIGGFLISVAFAIVFAVAMGMMRLLRDTVFPCLVAFQLIPKVALAPVFVVWLGTGTMSRLAFTVFISFFSILIALDDGLRAADPNLLKLCRSLHATRLRVLAYVQMPMAVPFLLSGMKIAITMAMIGAIIGEFISSHAGLGFLVLNAASRADTSLIMAAIVALCAWGMILYGAVEALDRILNRWFGS